MENDDKKVFSQSLNILLVDDNPGDLKLLQGMLEQYPSNINQIHKAQSLEETYKILRKNPVDVVVLDLNLPDSHGAETLVHFNEKFPTLAVVVNTGVYEDDLGLKTMSMGAQDFIVKGKYKSYGLVKAIHYAKERKRFEMELQAAYQRLQEAQGHLIQAEKLNVIGRLASGVAHEVKNPLATILFGITYLNEKLNTQDDKLKLTLKSISDSAKRANSIITDLLDFSSLSRLNKEPENLNDLIEKSLALTKHQINRRCIRVQREFSADLPVVSVDVNRLEQVVVNLILNSVAAMTDGGTLIAKTYSETVGDGMSRHNGKLEDFNKGSKLVFIELEDNGSGIPEDALDKIFDPFFTTRRSNGGVGLGLSVAKNIVEMHNGRLFLENRKEGGAKATLILKVD